MSAPQLITTGTLEALFATLARHGVRVLAPRQTPHGIELGEVSTPAQVADGAPQPVVSAKSVVFPKVERILGWRGGGPDVTLEDPPPTARPTLLFALRPCEARAFAALDAVFNWDTRDRFYTERMEKTTVVSVACSEADDACFCTALGSRPDDTCGSDVLLRRLRTGGYAADVLTDKGRALVALVSEHVTPLPADAVVEETVALERAFDGVALGVALARHFEDPVWARQSQRCLGCGACAYVCPTCACFDIQDEAAPAGGRRLRSWDSCGLRAFTLHASGHNPRDTQPQRWRQRVYHKFSYYPERLGRLGCVGCGKCTRACPVDMNLKAHLAEIARMA